MKNKKHSVYNLSVTPGTLLLQEECGGEKSRERKKNQGGIKKRQEVI